MLRLSLFHGQEANNINTDFVFMSAALELASLSAAEGEVPVGAVIVRNGEIISTGRNRRESERNALAHAELEAIERACHSLGGWRLWECEIYVTMEPCPMCMGAIINSRIKRVVFGAFDEKAGCAGSVMNMNDFPFNHKPVIEGGFMQNESRAQLSEFFAKLRDNKKSKKQSENNENI